MTKEFVPFELAVKLKQLGFDEPCFGWYADETHLSIRPQYIQPNDPNNVYNWCLASTFSQAFRWFREKYDLHSLIGIYPNTKEWYSSYQDLNWSGKETLDFNKTEDRSIRFKTFEEAELACLDKLIEIVETKQK